MSEPQTFALYRFYGAGGTLLYIGVTAELPRRLTQHNGDKDWWSGVSEVKVEHYPSREAVLAAERRAIQAERPLYNKVHNRPARLTPAPEPIISDDLWAEAYLLVTLHILESLPPYRVDGYKRKALELLGPAPVPVSLDGVELLGPATAVAWEDIYDRFTTLLDLLDQLLAALPADLGQRIRAEADSIVAATPSSDPGDAAFLALALLRDHFEQQESR